MIPHILYTSTRTPGAVISTGGERLRRRLSYSPGPSLGPSPLQGEGDTFGSREMKYLTVALATEPETPLGYGIATWNVASEVLLLRSTGGRVMRTTRPTATGSPLITMVTGAMVTPVTR